MKLLFPLMLLLGELFFTTQGTCAQSRLPDSVVIERIQYIRKVLDEGKKGANTWWNGWLTGYSAATLVQGTVWLTSKNKGTRQDMGLGAITTFLGAAGQIVTPMTPGKVPDLLSGIPENTPEERLIKLEKAEEFLLASCNREVFGRSWKAQAISGAVNIGAGMITWIGFKRTVWDGLICFGINTAITEAQIWSQPIGAVKGYRNYGNLLEGNYSSVNSGKLAWHVTFYPGRIGILVVL